MSQALDLLNGLSEDELAMLTSGPMVEGHIIIGSDRMITVPEALKRIAVQYDHNVETVTFDCPRYWDNLDMSNMIVYINYLLPDGTSGQYIVNEVTVDNPDDTIMHFDWTIRGEVTRTLGNISFLVCIKKTDDYGNEVNHWNSELNRDMYISEGLECNTTLEQDYPDIVTQLLERLSAVENAVVEGLLINAEILDGTLTATAMGKAYTPTIINNILTIK